MKDTLYQIRGFLLAFGTGLTILGLMYPLAMLQARQLTGRMNEASAFDLFPLASGAFFVVVALAAYTIKGRPGATQEAPVA